MLVGILLMLFQVGALEEYRIEIDPTLLDILYSNPFADSQFPGNIETESGSSTCLIGFRGNSSLGYPKKSWKIELTDLSLVNASHILLDAQYSDYSMMRNALALYLTRRLGHPAPLTKHIDLYINNEYYGVYTQVERIDEYFYARNALVGGPLFKAVEHSARFLWYPADTLATNGFEPRRGSDESLYLVHKFINDLNLNSSISVNSDQYLAYLAASVAISDQDGISKNFYLLLEDSNEWQFFPWDRDATFGDAVGGSYDSLWTDSYQLYNFGKTAIGSRMFLETEYRDQFNYYLQEAALILVDDLPFVVDSIYNEIKESVYADTEKACTNAEFDESVAILREAITQRGLFLHNMLGAIKAVHVNELTLSEWEFNLYSFSDSITVTIRFADEVEDCYLNYWTDGEPASFQEMNDDDKDDNTFTQTVPFPSTYSHLHFSVTYLAEVDSDDDVSISAFSYPYYGSSHPYRCISAPTARRSSTVFNPEVLEILSPLLYSPFVWSIPIVNTSEFSQDLSFCGFQLGSPPVRIYAGADVILMAKDTLFLTNDNVNMNILYPNNIVLGNLVTDTPENSPLSLLLPSWETSVTHIVGESSSSFQSDILLNELLALNDTTVADNFGEFDDFVEIINSGPQPVNLLGYYLTDNVQLPFQFAFPDTIIQPADHFIVWADGEPEQGNMHANFNLNSQGETIYLMNSLYLVDMVEFSSLREDRSYGRWPDTSGDWQVLSIVTPGSINEGGAEGDVTELSVQTANPVYANSVITVNGQPGLMLLEVFDLTGRRVDCLLEGLVFAEESVNWNVSSLSSGIYFLKLSSRGETVIQKTTVIR